MKKSEDPSKEKKPQHHGLLVEDESVAGGKDETSGRDVIRPKNQDGKVDEQTRATEARENRQETD